MPDSPAARVLFQMLAEQPNLTAPYTAVREVCEGSLAAGLKRDAAFTGLVYRLADRGLLVVEHKTGPEAGQLLRLTAVGIAMKNLTQPKG
jgi:hypothetical protein